MLQEQLPQELQELHVQLLHRFESLKQTNKKLPREFFVGFYFDKYHFCKDVWCTIMRYGTDVTVTPALHAFFDSNPGSHHGEFPRCNCLSISYRQINQRSITVHVVRPYTFLVRIISASFIHPFKREVQVV